MCKLIHESIIQLFDDTKTLFDAEQLKKISGNSDVDADIMIFISYDP